MALEEERSMFQKGYKWPWIIKPVIFTRVFRLFYIRCTNRKEKKSLQKRNKPKTEIFYMTCHSTNDLYDSTNHVIYGAQMFAVPMVYRWRGKTDPKVLL